MEIEHVRSRFIKHFDGNTGYIYTSPGRINLIGEHTDYNGGFVFPGAIDKGMMAEIRPNGTNKVRAYSIDLKDYVEFGLNEEDAPRTSWARYIFGVCREMIKRGVEVKGFNTAFSGDVPLGAGMSSSAALESTYAYALNDLFGDNRLDKFTLAQVGQATEHNYCGVNCGIMDQFASIFGKKDHLICLDCRSLEYQYYPFKPEGYKLVLLDSVVKHELASSAYNKRRQSCESAVAAIQKYHPEVKLLRDANMEMLDLPGIARRRLRDCRPKDVRDPRRHEQALRSKLRRTGFPERMCTQPRGNRLTYHGRRFRRLYDQSRKGGTLRIICPRDSRQLP